MSKHIFKRPVGRAQDLRYEQTLPGFETAGFAGLSIKPSIWEDGGFDVLALGSVVASFSSFAAARDYVKAH